MEGIRIDKWLWAARFFKTRALATRSCDIGRIQSNGVKAKPAREVHAGDRLRIENEGGIFEVDVKGLSAIRGPAAVAKALYEETAESLEARQRLAIQKKALDLISPLPVGRPSKRDRRRIIQFRGRGA
jgi:ribosome-associated heat shock protein Hsp15